MKDDGDSTFRNYPNLPQQMRAGNDRAFGWNHRATTISEMLGVKHHLNSYVPFVMLIRGVEASNRFSVLGSSSESLKSKSTAVSRGSVLLCWDDSNFATVALTHAKSLNLWVFT
jgi:hypothetical protein